MRGGAKRGGDGGVNLPGLTRSGYSPWARQRGRGDLRLRVVVGTRRGDVAVSNWIVTHTGSIGLDNL